MAKDKTTFVVIQDWMLRLGLDLTETVIFAIIYGFSQDGETRFRGSWKYLQDHALCSRAKVSRALKHLVDLQFVAKEDKFVNGIKFCEYYAEVGSGSGFAGGISEILPVSKCNSVVSEGNGGGISGKPNKKEDNIIDNIDSSNNAHTRVEAAPIKDQKKNIFEFGAALVAEGVTADHVARLLEIRKKKRLDNTKKAYDQLIESIHTICNMQGVTTDEVVAFMVHPQQNWGAIRPGWAGVERIKPAVKRSMKTMSIADLIDIETSKL